ncbi:MAG: hypothetical protein IJZ56_01575 [Oscillospiraceae bacterium]|nr:hypothetical protein [Oscillospiraceae bacterium]
MMYTINVIGNADTSASLIFDQSSFNPHHLQIHILVIIADNGPFSKPQKAKDPEQKKILSRS